MASGGGSDRVGEGLSIGDVAAATGLSGHTIRFYEREGLFPEPIRRDPAGRRLFTSAEVTWLKICSRLRSTGMPLADIAAWARASLEDSDDAVQERLRILRDHQDRVRTQLAEIQDLVRIIDSKVATYSERVAAGSADTLWTLEPSQRGLQPT